MKNIILIFITFFIFLFGYFVVKKLVGFIIENRRLAAVENDAVDSRVRIVAETPDLAASTASALRHCSETDSFIRLFIHSRNAKYILQRLSGGTIDIALLSETSAKNLNHSLCCVHIPYNAKQGLLDAPKTYSRENDSQKICVVWNNAIQNHARDRVIFALENENYRLKKGYYK